MTFDPYIQTNPWLQGLGGHGIPQTPFGVTQGLLGNVPLGITPHLAAWGIPQSGLHGLTQQPITPQSVVGGVIGSPLGQFGTPLTHLYSQLAPQTWLGGPQLMQSPMAQFLPQLALQSLYGNIVPQLGVTPFGISPYTLLSRTPHLAGLYGFPVF